MLHHCPASPLFCPSGVLVGPHDGGIDVVGLPVELAPGIGLLLDGFQDTIPDTGLAPAVETGGHRRRGAVPLG